MPIPNNGDQLMLYQARCAELTQVAQQMAMELTAARQQADAYMAMLRDIVTLHGEEPAPGRYELVVPAEHSDALRAKQEDYLILTGAHQDDEEQVLSRAVFLIMSSNPDFKEIIAQQQQAQARAAAQGGPPQRTPAAKPCGLVGPDGRPMA